ncbi:hypothetical protein ACE6H2_019405 [Prunus campanulata]
MAVGCGLWPSRLCCGCRPLIASSLLTLVLFQKFDTVRTCLPPRHSWPQLLYPHVCHHLHSTFM